MAQTRIIQQSFNGGEVTPEFFGRIEDVKRQNGAATMLNFVATPQGPATKRPGTTFVREAGDSSEVVRLIPFVYSPTQSFVLEFGAYYIRFHTDGGTLMCPAAAAWGAFNNYVTGDLVTYDGVTYQAKRDNTGKQPDIEVIDWYDLPATGEYQIATNYTPEMLFDLHYVQSNDVLTITHDGTYAKELRRYGEYDWRLEIIDFTSSVDVPSNAAHTTIGAVGTGTTVYRYQVTAVGDSPSDESMPSNPATGLSYTVSGITKANPGVITVSGGSHALEDGQPVYISGVLGMTQINIPYNTPNISNTARYYVYNGNKGAGTFSLTDYTGTPVNTSAFGAYTSGGTIVADGKSNDLLTTGNRNAITWSAVTGASYYNVYKEEGGVYGFIGQTANNFFFDENVAPDTSRTPPRVNYSTLPDTYERRPSAVCYFEQRRVFGGSTTMPQTIWMTRTGTESSLSVSIPSRDDDALVFKIASRQNQSIRHLVPLSEIVALTDSGEWRITSINGDAITPTTISVRPQSYVGASNVQPVVVNNVVIYAESRGGHVRELAFNQQAGGYMSNDLSIRSPHMFDGKTITDMTYSRSPFPVCWFTNDDGEMLGMTYVPEQQVWAWHKHETTNGLIESVCAIPESTEDALYMVVKRNIGGEDVRYIERMASRFFVDLEDAFFVDCGATYSGAPATTISGLDHLEGQEVAILADGAVHPMQTVTGGEITLEDEASVVHVGLPITADLETLPAVINTEAYGQSRAKNISRVWPRVYRSSGIYVGPNADNLKEIKQRASEPAGTPPTLRSEELEILIPPSWGQDGRILIRHTDPLPMTVVSITMEVSIGG